MWEKPSPSMAQGYNIVSFDSVTLFLHPMDIATQKARPRPPLWHRHDVVGLDYSCYLNFIVPSSLRAIKVCWFGTEYWIVAAYFSLVLVEVGSENQSFLISVHFVFAWFLKSGRAPVQVIKINYHVHVCYMYLGIMSEWERERETTIPWTSVIPIVAVPSSDSVYTLLPDVTTLPIAWHTQWKIYWAPLHIHAIHMYTYIHVHVQCTSFCSNRCFNVLFSSFRVFLSSSVALSWTLADLKSSWRFAT